jgi:hypothetical protein
MQEQTDVNTCPSCGKMFTGKFCSYCGEKQMSHHDLSMKHFAEESLESFTHFDNKFFRSIKQLLFKPGNLTKHFEEGRRVPFMKPVQLFVICNLLFFLLVGNANIFAVPLRNYIKHGVYIHYNTKEAFIKKYGSTERSQELSSVFDVKMANRSKAFIGLFIPFFAFMCALLFFKKRKFFSLHLVFATHFFTFLLLLFIIFHFIFVLPDYYFFHIKGETFDQFATTFNLGILVLYFGAAIRRFYKSSWLLVISSSILAGFLFIVLLQLYRIFLFYNILHSLPS